MGGDFWAVTLILPVNLKPAQSATLMEDGGPPQLFKLSTGLGEAFQTKKRGKVLSFSWEKFKIRVGSSEIKKFQNSGGY